jgi:CheY-like chemotaxis protein
MLLVLFAMNAEASVPGKQILLVDDDQGVREALKLLLSIDRHTVTEAASGHEAMEHLSGSSYDLVITDYLMPEMLGDELARRIKKRTPKQPVVLVTAYLEKLAGTRHPVDAILGKPVSLDELRQALISTGASATFPNSANRSNPGFNFAALTTRASATTSILDEILGRKCAPRTLPVWKKLD